MKLLSYLSMYFSLLMQAMWVYLPPFSFSPQSKYKCALYIQYYFTKIKVISIKMKNVEER